MSQIISWICFISIWFLSLQVMIFICEDTIKLFNKANLNNRKNNRKQVATNVTYSYKNKIAE